MVIYSSPRELIYDGKYRSSLYSYLQDGFHYVKQAGNGCVFFS